MMTTGKIRQTDGAPAKVSSRARARFGLGIMTVAVATTLSVTVLALSAAQAGTTGRDPAPVRNVTLVGNGPEKPVPSPLPKPGPTGPETGCCA